MDLNETRERIIYQKEGAIAKITLNWPEKANAQDQKLAEEVDAALLDADRDYDIKVSADGTTWSTVVQARANAASVTTHIAAATGRYVRLDVLAAEQAGNTAARIYESRFMAERTVTTNR